jgi:hypothetical protein
MLLLPALFLTFLFILTNLGIAGIYISDRPEGADVWVIISKLPVGVDCRIYSGDLVRNPSGSDIWIFVTNLPDAADKWISITDNSMLADSPSCLTNKY